MIKRKRIFSSIGNERSCREAIKERSAAAFAKPRRGNHKTKGSPTWQVRLFYFFSALDKRDFL